MQACRCSKVLPLSTRETETHIQRKPNTLLIHAERQGNVLPIIWCCFLLIIIRLLLYIFTLRDDEDITKRHHHERKFLLSAAAARGDAFSSFSPIIYYTALRLYAMNESIIHDAYRRAFHMPPRRTTFSAGFRFSLRYSTIPIYVFFLSLSFLFFSMLYVGRKLLFMSYRDIVWRHNSFH